jgi:hypothetical protein
MMGIPKGKIIVLLAALSIAAGTAALPASIDS